MVKTLSEADVGDATHAGGHDWNDFAMWVNGISNRIAPFINSITKFASDKLQLASAANSNVVISLQVNPTINGNYTLITPDVDATAGPHTLVSRNSGDILRNKTADARDNNLSGVVKFSSIRKTGQIAAGGVPGGGSGSGLLYGFIDMPNTPIRFVDVNFGTGWRYNTTSTANTPTGIRVPARFVLKEWTPYLRCKVRPVTTTNTQFYFGLSFQTQIPASNTPTANSESCLLVGWRSTDTNVIIMSNGGTTSSSASPSVTQTTVTKSSMSNQVRQIEITFTSASSCTVRIYDGNATSILYTSPAITTNLPADTMTPTCMIANTTTSPVDFDIFLEELDQSK